MDTTCALLADNLCDDEFDALLLANCEEHATLRLPRKLPH